MRGLVLVFCLSAPSIVRAWAPPAAIPVGRGAFTPRRHVQLAAQPGISYNNAKPTPPPHRQAASRLRCSAGTLPDATQLSSAGTLPGAENLSGPFAYFRDLSLHTVPHPQGQILSQSSTDATSSR